MESYRLTDTQTHERNYVPNKLRGDKSHICPDHPGCATPTKVVIWGGVPDIINHAKFYQYRVRGFDSPSGRNLPFSYAQRYGFLFYNRWLGIPPNPWLSRSRVAN